jgi:hypothetical protein
MVASNWYDHRKRGSDVMREKDCGLAGPKFYIDHLHKF